MQLADASRASIEALTARIRETSEHITTVSRDAEAQANGLKELAEATEQIDAGVQSTAALSEELAASSDAMAAESTTLSSRVAQFERRGGRAARAHADLRASPTLRLAARTIEPCTPPSQCLGAPPVTPGLRP
jgi:methyl-accepting chemotaxis protein